MRERGRDDVCQWIVKHVAEEQRAAKRRGGEPRVKVRLERSGSEAWVPKAMVESTEEE
jgi:hypothetical protein